MTPTARIADLVPHSGNMCLLERVVSWNEDGATLATTTHRNLTHPLADGGRLRAIHLCEYGAQAMAVHGGLMARARGERMQPGLLVSLRDVQLGCDHVHDLEGELFVETRRLHDSGSAWQYEFRVIHAGRLVAQGRAIVALASTAD